MGLDFINRVIKTTLLLAALVFIFGSYYFDWIFSLGVFSGALWGCANLWFIRQFIVHYLTSEERNPRKLILLAIIKFPVLYLIGFVILKLGWFAPLALVLGFSFIFVVILLKALGRLLLESGQKKSEIIERQVQG